MKNMGCCALVLAFGLVSGVRAEQNLQVKSVVREGVEVLITPIQDLQNARQVLLSRGVDGGNMQSLHTFLASILPEMVARTATDQSRSWEHPYFVWERNPTGIGPPREVLVFGGYFGPDSVVTLSTRLKESGGLQFLVRVDYRSGQDGEAFTFNLWQPLLPPNPDGPATLLNTHFEASYVKCKCDKAGGSKCTTVKCEGLKTCTTPGGPTGSCSYNVAE